MCSYPDLFSLYGSPILKFNIFNVIFGDSGVFNLYFYGVVSFPP